MRVVFSEKTNHLYVFATSEYVQLSLRDEYVRGPRLLRPVKMTIISAWPFLMLYPNSLVTELAQELAESSKSEKPIVRHVKAG